MLGGGVSTVTTLQEDELLQKPRSLKPNQTRLGGAGTPEHGEWRGTGLVSGSKMVTKFAFQTQRHSAGQSDDGGEQKHITEDGFCFAHKQPKSAEATETGQKQVGSPRLPPSTPIPVIFRAPPLPGGGLRG